MNQDELLTERQNERECVCKCISVCSHNDHRLETVLIGSYDMINRITEMQKDKKTKVRKTKRWKEEWKGFRF